MEALITALVGGFTTMATDALDGLGKVAPVVLPILAGLVIVGVVIKVVRKITGR